MSSLELGIAGDRIRHTPWGRQWQPNRGRIHQGSSRFSV